MIWVRAFCFDPLLVLGIDRLFVLVNRFMNDWLAPTHSGLGEKHRQLHPHALADDLASRLPLTRISRAMKLAILAWSPGCAVSISRETPSPLWAGKCFFPCSGS
jgi:hypothetical protein